MEHSIRRCLSRRTTEELEELLRFCLKEENFQAYCYVIPEILETFAERGETPVSMCDFCCNGVGDGVQ